MVSFLTPNEYNYNRATLRVLSRDFLVFKVRACKDAHLALLQSRGDRQLALTEIVLGGWGNTRSVIRKGMQGAIAADFNTTSILSCHELRTFWISWRGDRIQLGKGPIYGQQVFMFLNRTGDFAHDINDISMCTGFGSVGEWQIEENQGYELDYLSPVEYSYGNLWKSSLLNNGFMAFEVQSCRDVHVAISETHGVWRRRAYEFVIGGWNNSRSAIRRGLQRNPKIWSDVVGVLSCNEMRPFWISWRGGVLAVGRGYRYMMDVLAQWKDPRPRGRAAAIGFSTGFGSFGTFRLNMDLESAHVFNTPAIDQGYRHWLITPRASVVNLKVQACSDVYLAITSTPGQITDFGSEAFIGVNGKSGLMIQGTGGPEVEVDTPNILDCNKAKDFWISTKDNTLRIGTGAVHMVGTFITWKAPGTHYINNIGMATRATTNGTWWVRENMGSQMEVVTPPTYEPENNYLRLGAVPYRVFSVVACMNVTVVLSILPDNVRQNDIKINIGINNMKSSIEWASQSVVTETQNILHCRSSRTFWVGWVNDVVSFGKGSRYNQNLVLSAGNIVRSSIRNFHIASKGAPGTYIFESDRGDTFSMNTTGDYGFGYKYVSLKKNLTWTTFSATGCSDAFIALAAYHTSDAEVYEILIAEGSNPTIAIAKGLGTKPQVSKTLNFVPMFCDTYQNFWVSWEGGLIKVGLGVVPNFRQAVMWQDPKPHEVVSLGFSSGNGNPVQFTMAERDGVEVTYDTIATPAYNQLWMTTRHRSGIVLQAKACQEVSLLLCEVPGYVDKKGCYNITLGRDKLSYIKSGEYGRVYARADTPYLLSCDEMRSFWVSWYDGHIIVGKGDTLWRKSFLNFQDMNHRPVRGLSISTLSTTGQFRVAFKDAEFAQVVPAPSGGLGGGAVAGIVIGFLVLFALFGVAVFVILRPPAPVQRILGYGAGASSSANGLPQSFDNPLGGANNR